MSEKSHKAIAAAEYGIGMAGAAVPTAAATALLANTQAVFRTSTQLTEHVTVQASAELGHSSLESGLVSANLPNLATHVPIIGRVGAHVDLTQFDIHANAQGLAELARLTDFSSAVAAPIQHEIITRLAVGGGIGAFIGSVLGAAAVHKLRQKGPVELARDFKAKLMHRPTRVKAIMGAMAVAAPPVFIAGCASGDIPAFANTYPSASGGTPLTAIWPGADKIKVLKAATISGSGADIAKVIIKGVNAYVSAVDSSVQSSTQKELAAIESYELGPGKKYNSAPNVTTIWHVSDWHCNKAFYKYNLTEAEKAIEPDLVLNTGDTDTNSGTMPWESDCESDFVKDTEAASKAIGKKIEEVNVDGDHDPDIQVPGTKTPDKSNNYTVTADSITFVGDNDPTKIVNWAIWPSSKTARNKLEAAEGSLLAKRAAQVYSSTGQLPWLVVHDPEAGYEAALDGVIQAGFAGHWHQEQGIQKFTSVDGQPAIFHVSGSTTGANIGLTIEETPQLPATSTIIRYNTLTRRFLQFAIITTLPGGDTTIKVEDAPTETTPNNYPVGKAAGFLNPYSSTWGKNVISPKLLGCRRPTPDQTRTAPPTDQPPAPAVPGQASAGCP